MRDSKRLLAAAVAAALGMPTAVYATNGMNLEGYGPIATGMGGASMAYDNGTAAVMNNPATLGLMDEGDRLDIALGELAPDVAASMPAMGQKWSSGGDSYFMPAVGWTRTMDNGLTFGAGVFAQGGMGTEFGSGGPGADFTSMGTYNDTDPNGNPLPNTALVPAAMQDPNITDVDGLDQNLAAEINNTEERSEVSVARVILPVAKKVDDKITVGGSLDYVRASMDVKMFMTGAAFGNLLMDQRVSGSMVDTLNAYVGGNPNANPPIPQDMIRTVWGASLDFSDNNDYSGAATGQGFAAKLGGTFKVNPRLTVGASYHSKTSLSHLDGSATMGMAVEFGNNAFDPNGNPIPAGTDQLIPVSGNVKVHNFEWPSTYALGAAFQANEKLMLVADIKQINWSNVMKDFSVVFTAGANQANPAAAGFAGQKIRIDMPQNWDDQTVIQLGGSYQINDKWTARAGYNGSSNPVPSDTVNYLFPATVENHYTAGFGHTFNDTSSVDFSLAYAPEVKVTGSGADNQGLEVTHAQTNWQVMYSHRF